MDGMRYGIMDEAFRIIENQMSDVTVLYNARHICRGMDSIGIRMKGKQVIYVSYYGDENYMTVIDAVAESLK